MSETFIYHSLDYKPYNRVDGPVIFIDRFGTKLYYLGNQLHREDGPAVETIKGSFEWWIRNKRHRADGPAMEMNNGDKYWFLNDKIHRIDGPAIEYANGIKSWYYYGKLIKCSSQKEFEKLIKLKSFW